MTTFFDVYTAEDWDNAINTIANGKENVRYSITLHNDITITPIIDDDYTFGGRKGIKILIKGKYIIYIKSKGALLHIHEYQNIIIKDVTLQGLPNNDTSLVNSDGDFYMKGYSKITGNTNTRSSGGGVFVYFSGSITMRDNSMITGNNAKKGGGVFTDCTLLAMYDNATISDNTAENGGGVNTDFDSTLVMHDNSKITNNRAASNGGGVYVTDHSYFVMKDNSVISENTAEHGGGVYIDYAGPSFDMKDNATVAGNTAINGGGVYNRYCELSMSDNAIITTNTAIDKGGAIYIESKGRLEKNGGIIYGSDEPLELRNIASVTEQNSGHVVYWDSLPARYRNNTASLNDNTTNDDFWIEDSVLPNADKPV